ncbi:MAG: hypothetical protein LBP36_03485 [Oscillospiraceae bacterium]|nr:hypothetical protein [Oscillospiraceae bacterium]
MKDLVEEILEADRCINESFGSSERLKIESAKKIKEFYEKRREEYLSKARENIRIIEKIESIKLQNQIRELEKKVKNSVSKMDLKFEKNKREWTACVIGCIVG